MHETQLMSIRALVTDLYRTSKVAMPTIQRAITPLGRLINSFNLVCIELPNLSHAAALRYLVQQGGIIELPDGLEQEQLAGFLYVNTHHGCVFIEQNDPLVRRRFSVAHELGHYLLHFRPLLAVVERDQSYLEISESLCLGQDTQEAGSGLVEIAGEVHMNSLLPPYEQMEREANLFAAELLMPVGVVRGLFARALVCPSEADITTCLATTMLVSEQSMRLRLGELKLLPLSRMAS